MTSPQKNKGNKFERDIAAILNDVFQTTQFVRAPGSGSYIGGKNNKRIETLSQAAISTYSGDISLPDGFTHIDTIECKHYANIPYHQILAIDCKLLDGWIEQAGQHNNRFWLFIKADRMPIFVIGPDIKSTMSYKGLGIATIDQFRQQYSK